MALSDAQVRSAKARDKNYKLYDADGLFVLVTIAGGKLWRFKYRFAGKEKVIDLPPVFRTKSCLRDGLLGRGSHAQGAVYG
jgi:hypothetical protein